LQVGGKKLKLRPKNWDTFQHYKDRRPAWIKLHHALVDDPSFHALKGEDAKYLVLIWLIASEELGNLPPNSELAWRLRISVKQLDQLLARLQAWIVYDASKPLAEPEQVATPEKRRGEEEEIEGEKRTAAPLLLPTYVPPPPPPSPGSNGEFIAATALLQDCEIPATSSDIRLMAQLVQIEAKHHGGVEGALQYLVGEVTAGRARGEPVTVFWLKDRKYLAKEKDIYAEYSRSTA
jgi:hypothetical protein